MAAAKAESSPATRIKLKSWRGNLLLHEASTQRTLVLGSNIDLGGVGACRVTSLELDTSSGLIWYTLTPVTPGNAPLSYFLKDTGIAEPLNG